MAEEKKYKKGDIIKFRDHHDYEVLSVHNTGLLVGELSLGYGMSNVYYFNWGFLEESKKRNHLMPERVIIRKQKNDE